MPEVVHSQLSAALKKGFPSKRPSLYLIHGQAALVAQARELLVAHLLAGASRDLCCEGMEGLLENVPEALERMNTYAMTADPTIVLFKDAKLFESEGDDAEARLDHLMRAIEKGFPGDHFLVITVNAKVPKNRKFYKAVNSHGLIVDCNVPTGDRKADKAVQETVLKGILNEVLGQAGKRMAPRLFARLQELTGFDPVVFRDNLRKLVDYSGRREEIVEDDIAAVLRRTKVDPLYALTNAVAERDVANALVLTDGLLGGEWHPLQIVTALANQVRKLLVAKDFTVSAEGRTWHAGIPYPQFQSGVMPAVQAYDGRIAQRIKDWSDTPPSTEGEGKKKAGAKPNTDLALATGSASAYPVFQTLAKSAKYGRGELIQALERLSVADMLLKSSDQNPGLVLRTTIMAICAGQQEQSTP
ncbi:DNA polymerase III subunit delta [Desulfatitalea alkaliphila]|uniref:DNA polymerase III subunit delta n=1 Tax=Desulfatitalea alkaliphila TaxID=2929485 RepID=A0AA41R0P4_9BACT|nr:hypothetical protein [Desulfatitalea alkaliphila]MCJ8500059.1 hypothetical protein [Desulfatitalea alkaliphila]